MRFSGFNLALSLLLAVVCWVGSALPSAAQPFDGFTPIVALGKMPLFSFSGTRPQNLGVKDGKLLACPNSPNCVNSQTADADKEHAIAPLTYNSTPTEAMANLKSVITSLERTKIITESENYLYAEFTSALMGFVDDVEFYLDPSANVIQVRSASRLGESDLGVNRSRIETIRSQFAAVNG